MGKDDKKDDKKKSGTTTKKKVGKRLADLYTVTGDKIVKKNKTCPKCGPGMFLANHKDRVVCGKCFYVEMKGKS